MIQELIVIGVLLFFSALFSGSETALVSLDSIKIKRMQKQNKDTRCLQGLLSNPTRFLTTILIGNMLVNITLSTVLTSVLIKTLGNRGLAVSIGAATFLLLIFGEVTPKTFAIKRAEAFSYNVARPLEIFARIIFPIRYVFNFIAKAIIRAFGIRLDKELPLTSDELQSVIELSHKHGIVKENEKEMIRSVLELTKADVQSIMTPRPDIKALSVDKSQKEALDFLKKVKHSKVPIYKGTIDNITGILYAKDLFFSPNRDFRTLSRPAIFVPETMKIDDLLKDFQSQKSKVAIVVDEYGNTYGLVTFEDILEEIVGEIYDEFETKEQFIAALDKKTFRISGKSPIDLVNEELNLNIPKGDYDTIAGYMLYLFEKIPQEGEIFKKGNLSFCIEKLVARRIKSIILKRL
ncbi:hemolysin family protein [Candidatus Omnitrophota bacterium]